MPVPLQVLTYCGSYINFTYRHSVCGSYHVVFKGPFIASQLNSTRLDVELRRRSVYSDADATQLNSTQLNLTRCRVVDTSIAARRRNSTQRNSTRRWVELSCVAINGPWHVNRAIDYSIWKSNGLNYTCILCRTIMLHAPHCYYDWYKRSFVLRCLLDQTYRWTLLQ